MIGQVSDEEAEVFRRLALHEPKILDIMMKRRAMCYESLEQVNNDMVRGQCQLYTHMLELLNPTR